MATPVVRRMLQTQEWWHVADDAAVAGGKKTKALQRPASEDPSAKDARLSGAVYHHMMLRLGEQELAKLKAETKAASQAQQELRAQRDAAVRPRGQPPR